MKHNFLVFTFLAVIAVTTMIIKQVPLEPVWQFKKMNIKVKPIVLLLFSQNTRCSAVLIHEKWLLTTAHCFTRLPDIYLISRENTSYEETTLKSILLFPHPNFTWDSVDHDIMLIKINASLNLKDRVQQPVLPSSKDDRIGETCTVCGWTQQWYDSVSEFDIQVHHDVFWLPNEFCYAPETPLAIRNAKNIFCATSNLQFTHSEQGPHDAVLLCQDTLYGILVWTHGCVLKGDLGYYIKISHYTDWIHKIIKNN